jgi:hypothetical protein
MKLFIIEENFRLKALICKSAAVLHSIVFPWNIIVKIPSFRTLHRLSYLKSFKISNQTHIIINQLSL